MFRLFSKPSDPQPVRITKAIARLVIALVLTIGDSLGASGYFASPPSSDRNESLAFFLAMGLVAVSVAVHAALELRNEWLDMNGLPSPLVSRETRLKKAAEVYKNDMNIYNSAPRPSAPVPEETAPLLPLPGDDKKS